MRVVTSHLRSFHRGLMRLRCISAVVGARAKVVKSVLPLVGIAYPSEVEGSLVLLVVVPIAPWKSLACSGFKFMVTGPGVSAPPTGVGAPGMPVGVETPPTGVALGRKKYHYQVVKV